MDSTTRIRTGIAGLSRLEILMACRAAVMAAEMFDAWDIRAMDLKDAMLTVAYVPKTTAVNVMHAVGLDLCAAARLYDACKALTEIEDVITLSPDPSVHPVGIQAQIGAW